MSEDRDRLGRIVREAWTTWARAQPNIKPSWLLPFDHLDEPDKEVDRQIGETVERVVLADKDAHKRGSDMTDLSPDFADRVQLIWTSGRLQVWADIRGLEELDRLRTMLDACMAIFTVATPQPNEPEAQP